jgi:drug/metabolite transporter (DMT)-like permease
MFQPFLYASVAAIGNSIFVYAQRSASYSENPFLFVCASVLVCLVMLTLASLVCKTPGDGNYLLGNWTTIAISGIGLFITFLGFFLLYNKFGASQFSLYAVISIVTTSVGVGVLIFREPFNIYQFFGTALAVLSIVVFIFGKTKAI